MDIRSDLRNTIGNSLESNLSSFLDNDGDDNYFGEYVGKIVNNVDPDNLGRCQIRVYGVFDNLIPDEDLPWALPNFNFVGSLVGSYIVPPIGAIVKVNFDKGDIYLPYYSTKVVDKNNRLSDVRNLNFDGNPNTLIFFETDEGDFFKIDKENKIIEFRTAYNDFIKVDRNGNIEINTMEATGILNGKITINAKGEVQINAPVVSIPHDASGLVTPNVTGTGGPFCALPVDPMTGMVHQGFKVVNS